MTTLSRWKSLFPGRVNWSWTSTRSTRPSRTSTSHEGSMKSAVASVNAIM